MNKRWVVYPAIHRFFEYESKLGGSQEISEALDHSMYDNLISFFSNAQPKQKSQVLLGAARCFGFLQTSS